MFTQLDPTNMHELHEMRVASMLQESKRMRQLKELKAANALAAQRNWSVRTSWIYELLQQPAHLFQRIRRPVLG